MRLTTSLFTASFLSVVVAGWAQLDASGPTDGPARKPALRDVTIDGAPVHISVDRDRVPTGEAVQVTLALTEARASGADVRVAVLEQTGSPESRVMRPPREVSSQVVHLGSEPTVLPIKLASSAPAGADPLAIAGNATQYTISVSSAKKDGGEGEAAVPVFAYQPEAFRLTIDTPAPGKVGDAVDLVVHVKSLAKKPLRGLTISTSSTFATVNDTPMIDTLAPGEEKTVTLHGTRVAPDADNPMLVQAYGWAQYGGDAAAFLTIDPSTGAIAEHASEPYERWNQGG